MIVRISGAGQYELNDAAEQKLRDLDHTLTEAMHGHREDEFHRALHSIVTAVREQGRELSHDELVPSDVIVPPEDISLEEAHRFFTDEGLLHPVPA